MVKKLETNEFGEAIFTGLYCPICETRVKGICQKHPKATPLKWMEIWGPEKVRSELEKSDKE